MNIPNTHSKFPVYLYEPSLTPNSSSIGGITPVEPPTCTKCHSSMYLLLTLDASYNNLYRTLYIYGCNKEICSKISFQHNLEIANGVFSCRREQKIVRYDISLDKSKKILSGKKYKKDVKEDIKTLVIESISRDIETQPKDHSHTRIRNDRENVPCFQHNYLTYYEELPYKYPDGEKGDRIDNSCAKKTDFEINKMITSYLKSEKDLVTCKVILNKLNTDSDEQHENVKNEDFDNYMNYISLHPKHVVRYIYGGIPLWSAKTSKIKIPRCECGSRRIFECQLMPTILDILRVDECKYYEGSGDKRYNFWMHGGSMNWGNLAIYSCEKSCEGGKEEIVVIQDALDSVKAYE